MVQAKRGNTGHTVSSVPVNLVDHPLTSTSPVEADPHEELTYRAAKELGLMNPVPPSEDEYDYMLILGGLATGVEPRVRYAAKLVNDGLKIRKQIAGLGSFRELQDKELPISRKYAPEGRYEIDHLMAMVDVFFEAREPWRCSRSGDPEVDPKTASSICIIEPASLADCPPSYGAYSAASSAPLDRVANTADTYEVFVRENKVVASESLLLITSAIYAPYQHFDAIRSLGTRHAVACETIGLLASGHRSHSPRAYRQEIRSALRSAMTCLD